jgi:hypothetical protein
MTHDSRNAASSAPTSRRRRIRSTLGDLIAAAYDALGPDAAARDVARLLTAPVMVRQIATIRR